MKVGIIGITNCGKTTIFNVLTGKRIETTGFSSGSLEPNFGQAEVPDPRIDALTEMFKPKKRIPPTVDFVDVVGLVKGASKGEGLGNQFLNHIRNCDALLHVVRDYESENAPHPSDRIDPAADFDIVNIELLLADLGSIENRIDRLGRKGKIRSEDRSEFDLMNKCRECLEFEKPLSDLDLTEEERRNLKSFALLSLKPQMVVVNVSEDKLGGYSETSAYKGLLDVYGRSGKGVVTGTATGPEVLWLSGRIEMEIMDLPLEEREGFLADYDIKAIARDKVVRASYDILDRFYFFTVGPDEVRAWTVRKGAPAVECAGAIHSDLSKGFIRAEVVRYEDLISLGSLKSVKDSGKFRLEGKEYSVQDGDILNIRFNV